MAAERDESQPLPLPDGAQSAPPTPVPVQTVRFCRSCGRAWDPAWADCPQCSAPPAPHRELSFQRDLRAVKSAVALYFALLAVSLAMLIILLAQERDATAEEELVAGAVFSIVTLAWSLPHRGELLPLLRNAAAIKWYVGAVLLAVPTFVIASAIVTVLNRMFDLEDITYSESFLDGGYGWGWVVLAICVQPGVFEELGFRGVILSTLERALGSKEALLVSALMFAILHLSIPSIPHLFLIGLVLGWLRIQTGSLYPGMLMHFTHNLLVVLSEADDRIWPW